MSEYEETRKRVIEEFLYDIKKQATELLLSDVEVYRPGFAYYEREYGVGRIELQRLWGKMVGDFLDSLEDFIENEYDYPGGE